MNKKWHIRQYDVKNAFVHADIDSDIYTILPTGLYRPKDPAYQNKCCHLKKALYGLKQAPRLWSDFFTKAIANLEFDRVPIDEGIYINSKTQAIIITYVDDIIIIHKDLAYINKLATAARQYIQLEEIGELATFLGNNISLNYQDQSITIDQNDYISKILSKFATTSKRPKKTPGEVGIYLRKNQLKASEQTINLYQKEIGSLLYTSLKTRPDIAYPVAYCSRYISNPDQSHISELKKI